MVSEGALSLGTKREVHESGCRSDPSEMLGSLGPLMVKGYDPEQGEREDCLWDLRIYPPHPASAFSPRSPPP